MFNKEELEEIKWAIENSQYEMSENRKLIRESILHQIDTFFGCMNAV